MSKYSAWVKPSFSNFSKEMSQEQADISEQFYRQLYETAKVISLSHEDIIGMQRGMGDIPSVEMLLEDAIEDPEIWRFAKEHQQVGGLIERLLDNRPVDMPIVIDGTRGGYTALSGRHRLVYSVALDIPVKVFLLDGEEFNLADWGSRKRAEGNMQNFRVAVRTVASKDFQKAPVLFRIRTVDVPIEVDGKPDVIPGGAEYDVISFEEGKYYVTNQEYKSGVPQLIPWMAAKKISANVVKQIAGESTTSWTKLDHLGEGKKKAKKVIQLIQKSTAEKSDKYLEDLMVEIHHALEYCTATQGSYKSYSDVYALDYLNTNADAKKAIQEFDKQYNYDLAGDLKSEFEKAKSYGQRPYSVEFTNVKLVGNSDGFTGEGTLVLDGHESKVSIEMNGRDMWLNLDGTEQEDEHMLAKVMERFSEITENVNFPEEWKGIITNDVLKLTATSTAGSPNGDFSVKIETQFYSDAEVPASYSNMVKKQLAEIAAKNPEAYVSIGIDGHADESRHSQGFSLPTWTLKDGAVKTDHQPWSVKLQNWSVNVNYKGISSETVSDLKQLANTLASLFR